MHLWRELFIVDGHALLRQIASVFSISAFCLTILQYFYQKNIVVFFSKNIAEFSQMWIPQYFNIYCQWSCFAETDCVCSIFLKNMSVFFLKNIAIFFLKVLQCLCSVHSCVVLLYFNAVIGCWLLKRDQSICICICSNLYCGKCLNLFPNNNETVRSVKSIVPNAGHKRWYCIKRQSSWLFLFLLDWWICKLTTFLRFVKNHSHILIFLQIYQLQSAMKWQWHIWQYLTISQ